MREPLLQNAPTENPEQSRLLRDGRYGKWVWEKIIKRSPGYVYEVFDAISPIKTRDIDMSKDLTFGVFPFQVPPALKGLYNLGTEAIVGDPDYNNRQRRILQITVDLMRDNRENTLTPKKRSELKSELGQLLRINIPATEKLDKGEPLKPRDMIEPTRRKFPTWTAMYDELVRTIPGLGEWESVFLGEPENIPKATERFIQKFENEPLDTISLGLGAAKASLIEKSRKLRALAAHAPMAPKALDMIAQAEKLDKSARILSYINPDEVVIGAVAGATNFMRRVALPPSKGAYNPQVEGTYARDPKTNEDKITSIRPVDFAESIGIDKELLPMAVMSDYDYAAMVEGWARFYDSQGKFQMNTGDILEDSVRGAAHRFVVTKNMLLEYRKRHVDDMAHKVGAPASLADLNVSSKHGIEIYKEWHAQLDKAVNDLSKQIAPGTSTPHDAGKITHNNYEEWQLGRKLDFEDEFGEIKEHSLQPLKSQIDYLEATDIEPIDYFEVTRTKLRELQVDDSRLLGDLDLKKLEGILNSIFEMADKEELRLRDFDKMRTNFRKQLSNAVQNGEMTKIGKKEASSLFYHTLTEDFYNVVEKEVTLNPDGYPEGMLQKVRKAKADYFETVVKLEDSPAITFLRKTEDTPSQLIDELLKEKGTYNPDQLAILKNTLGEDGWTSLQSALLDRFVGEATNPSTGNIYQDKLEKMIHKLNNTDPDKAVQLFGEENVLKLRKIATRTKIENSKAAKYLENADNARANIVEELLKTNSVFIPEELQHLKEILGTGYNELKPGLLMRIYDMAANKEKNPESINPKGLRNVLDSITARDKNRLVELLDEDTAEFLEQSALFTERFARATTYHSGSPTAKLQKLLGTGSGVMGVTALADVIGMQLIYGGYNITKMSAPQYIGIAVLTASWGTAAGYNKFIMGEGGRKWLMEGWEYNVPNTNITISADTLEQAADWMTENKFELGFSAHRLGRAEKEVKEKKEEENTHKIIPNANPFRGFTQRVQ